MDEKIKKIEDLGYDSFFESNRIKLGLETFQIARVIAEHKGSYNVKNTEGEYLAKITGKQIFKAKSREDYPAVGDWVAINELNNNQVVIKAVLPRRSIIKRRFGEKNKSGEKSKVQIIASNIDVAFIVQSIGRDFSVNRFERYLTVVKDSNIEPVIIINKTDLVSQEELDLKLSEIKNRLDRIEVIPTSTVNNEGLDKLKKYIQKGRTYCFLGSSGVGKSSLINKLLEKDNIKTGDVSSYSDRGKHITTSREMYLLKEGGVLVDNPGVREVGMTDAGAGLGNLFNEIKMLAKKCKFIDCTHIHEPGCAVLASLELGDLDRDKYNNYIGMKKEIEHFEMTEFEKKEKDKQFGKFIKKAKNDLKRYRNKDYGD